MLPLPVDRFDLLPPERRRALRQGYLRRLFVVAALLVVALALIACALLYPTYRYLANTGGEERMRLADLSAQVASAENGTLAKRYAGLEADAGTIVALATPPPASAVLRDALAVPRSGIALVSLNYAPASGKHPGTLTLGGTAASRDDLRAYQLALEETSEFASADLPVSSFAKDTNLPFTITVTLASTTAP